ncbi:ATP-binding protein [Spirillospora sp. CA-128828]|uniref:ATP-binding protein n=1 Tax=Spirillospora sp. CA-128828 TaxID=3240033 RepID=UPI003D915601
MHTTGTGTTRPADGRTDSGPDGVTDAAPGGAGTGGGSAAGAAAAAAWELDADPRAASRARALTTRTLRRWHVTDTADVDDIVLIVDELITNAVVHGTGPVHLTLRLDRGPASGPQCRPGGSLGDRAETGDGRRARLTGEVGDGAAAAPGVPAGPPPVLDWSEAGRGLLLVAALATEFGARPAPSGKTVWFTRSLSPPAAVPGGNGAVWS